MNHNKIYCALAGETSGGGDTFLPLHSFLPQRAARSTSRCYDLIKVPRSSLYCGGSAIALFFLLFSRPPTSPSRCHISSRAHSAHPPGMLTRYGTVVRCWFDGVRERHSRSAGGTNGGDDMFLPLRTFLSQRAARSSSRSSDPIRVPRSSLYCGGSL